MRLTFDLNCIIAIEKGEGTSISLIKLIRLHDAGKVLITVPAISGSEKLRDGNYSNTFNDFKKRISCLSQKPIEILKPLAYLGISFLDYCIYSNDDLITLDKKIQEILFPDIPYLWQNYIKKFRIDKNTINDKWVNKRCDAVSMWCHIYYENDIFVTNDHNFFKQQKLNKLIDLGANRILKPIEALKFVKSHI